jgi:alkylation response protein AidB-like acyl-CoA dehydrogenase
MPHVLDRARRIAEEVLFPAALATDASPLVPRAPLDLLAEEGFYGIAAPAAAGGWDLPRPEVDAVVEVLASGCLTTTFVWLQHHNAMRAVATSALAGAWAAPMARGDRRAGIALVGERAGSPLLTAEQAADGGWVLRGEAPWVTGWGRVDVVLVAARHGDHVVRLLVDAEVMPTLGVEPLALVAANASGTVTLRFDGHVVPAGRFVNREPHADVVARDPAGLRTNGSLALGVASRCCALLEDERSAAELATVRDELDAAGPEALPRARARASAFALRAAAALVVAHGARSILAVDHAQRLAREALFVQVFGSRPSIRAALLDLGGVTDPRKD